jgi:hypothetical protein
MILVAGVGQTGPSAEDRRSIPEMVLAAVEAALADAGLAHDAVESIVTASVDLFDGLTASNVAITEVVGAVMRPETRIAADGICAAIHAACQLRAEAYDTVLVVAHGKASASAGHEPTAWAMDPINLQPLGVDFDAAAGLAAQEIAAREPGALERWERLGARHAAAARAVGSDHSTRATAREVRRPPSPLSSAMVAPSADAACAVVLRRVAADRSGPGVALTGVGWDLDAHELGERALTRWDGLRRACRMAYADAGIYDPSLAFGLLEPSCSFAHEEELFLEAIGPVAASTLISPDGGLFAGAAPVAAGLSRVVAAVTRLRREPSLRRALAHGTWGPAGQGQAVTVLEVVT